MCDNTKKWVFLNGSDRKDEIMSNIPQQGNWNENSKKNEMQWRKAPKIVPAIEGGNVRNTEIEDRDAIKNQMPQVCSVCWLFYFRCVATVQTPYTVRVWLFIVCRHTYFFSTSLLSSYLRLGSIHSRYSISFHPVHCAVRAIHIFVWRVPFTFSISFSICFLFCAWF